MCVCVCVTGEQLEYGIKNVLLLQADEAVVVTAQEEFDDVLPDGNRGRDNTSCNPVYCRLYWFIFTPTFEKSSIILWLLSS